MKIFGKCSVRASVLLCALGALVLGTTPLPAGQITKQVVTVTVAASGTTATSADFTAVPGIVRTACSSIDTTGTITLQTSNGAGTTAIPVKSDTVTAAGEIDGFAATAVSGTMNLKVVLSSSTVAAKTITFVLFIETE